VRPWWLHLLRFGRPHRRELAQVLALMLAGVAFEALRPWPLKLVVDYVLTGRPLPASTAWISHLPGADASTIVLAWLAAGTLLLFVGARAAHSLQVYLQVGMGMRMACALGALLFDHIQRLGPAFHAGARRGDLVRRVTVDSACVRELLIGVGIPFLTSLASLAVMFAIMWKLHHTLALVALGAAIPLGLLIRVTAGRMMQRTYEQQEHESRMMALAEQTLTSLPLVQAFGREQHEDRRFQGLSGRTRRATMRAMSSQLQFKFGVGAATAAGTAVIMGIGGFNVLEGSLTVGSLLVFMSYLVSLYTPLEDLAYLSTGFASAAARAGRVFEVLDTEVEVSDRPGAVDLPLRARGQRGHVSLEGVWFDYQPGRPVLKDVDLTARPGEVVALTGESGAGKTTLVSLIPRFVDPVRGRVSFDGADLRELRLATLRAEVALVPQEPLLLPLTIAENIVYGRPDASREAVMRAAAAANAADFIERMPLGYDSVIGERGATLSGGERQRLAIARAILRDASVVILDEPTSALDAETEALVLDALMRLMENRTTFVIAHRLSTVRRADRIVVLERGLVVETGSHDELLAKGGAYARLAAGYHDPADERGTRP
jgi:ATP-binding cassette subfamily B protein/subfamily B ATP-binding cassette protein MsbA